MNPKSFLPYLVISLFILASCKDDHDSPGDNNSEAAISFVHDVMSQVYLWNTQMPRIDYTKETNASDYFYKLRVKEDTYSVISDNAQEMLSSLQGIEKSYGFHADYVYFKEDKVALGFIGYVYPISPASKAGITRGDIISSINGKNIIQDEDIRPIYNAPSVTLGISKYVNGQLTKPATISLTMEVIQENPVHTYTTFDIAGTKIAYLFYTSFIENFNTKLDEAFAFFKQEGATELILDLRYNLGGDNEAMINLCSHIVPKNAATNKELIIKNQYNAEVEAYYKSKGTNTNNYFTDAFVNDNLDLKRVFILTSDNTASASEATILGLQPYMNVTCIGETTVGKYTGMSIIQGEKELSNWIVLPVVAQYKNKNDQSAKGGISPTYQADYLYLPMVELGNPAEPLIAKAIGLITNQPVLASKSVNSCPFKKFGLSSLPSKEEIRRNYIIQR